MLHIIVLVLLHFLVPVESENSPYSNSPNSSNFLYTNSYICQTPPPNQRNRTSPLPPTEEETNENGKVKWSKEATILLISGWLNTSKDSIVGIDQTSTSKSFLQ